MPSSRLRVYQYLPHLKKHGIEGTALPALPEPWFSRFYYSRSKWVRGAQYLAEFFRNLWRVLESRRYDLVYVQKGILTTNVRFQENFLKKFSRRFVFDLDDEVYGNLIVEFRWPFLRRLQDPHQTEKLSSLSRAVVAGNRHLRDLALRYNPRVFVIPTPVDTDRFRPALPLTPSLSPLGRGEDEGKREIVLGWMGIPAGLDYLAPLAPVFQELSHRYPIRLRLVTRKPDPVWEVPGVKIEWVPWVYGSEVESAGAFDIGLSPLADDEWTRGKCGLKLLQYMAMGLASVSSRVGANLDIVEEGVDGFLATEAGEWLKKLSLLIEDAALRKRMGEAARKKAEEKFSLKKTAPQLAEVLKEVCQS